MGVYSHPRWVKHIQLGQRGTDGNICSSMQQAPAAQEHMHTALQHHITPASSSGVWRAACAWGLDLIQKACLSMPGIQASMSIFLYAGAPRSLVGMSCGESLQRSSQSVHTCTTSAWLVKLATQSKYDEHHTVMQPLKQLAAMSTLCIAQAQPVALFNGRRTSAACYAARTEP